MTRKRSTMTLKRGITPAHREYFVTLVRNNGEREPHYLPYAYETAEAAQADCDRRNAHYRHGELIVEFIDRPASVHLRNY